MRRVGVILCSKSKQDYACSVREMYDPSLLFKSQKNFMDMVYDEWYVNTSKYGFMSPEMEIEPYDSWYINPDHWIKGNKLSQQQLNDWLELVKQQFPNPEEIELHAHVSTKYYDKLKTIFPNIVHFKPVGLMETAWRYTDACYDLLDGHSLEEIFWSLNQPHIARRPKEEPKWFYHVNGDKFYGKGRELAMKHNVDMGGSYGLSMGSRIMAFGWALDKNILPYIYQTDSGQYRLQKNHPFEKTDKGERTGMREALLKLEEMCNF